MTTATLERKTGAVEIYARQSNRISYSIKKNATDDTARQTKRRTKLRQNDSRKREIRRRRRKKVSSRLRDYFKVKISQTNRRRMNTVIKF